MSKVPKIKTPAFNIGKNRGITSPLDAKFTGKHIEYDDLPPAFSFVYAQESYCLSKWETAKIKGLIKALGMLEQYKWKDILNLHIKDFKHVANKQGLTPTIPPFITPDMRIYYFKPFGSNTPHRVFGIRDKHNFKFLWFDCKHEVYPGKY